MSWQQNPHVGSPYPPPANQQPLAQDFTPGDITDELMAKSVWNDVDLYNHQIPVYDIPFVTVGGGLGSFALVDTLRIAGIATSEMAVLTNLAVPSDTYEHLATNSQIPRNERLRSDSGSVMDCIWGWPGYGIREAFADKSIKRLWQVFSEPIFSEYFTPKAGQVYESVEREMARINWSAMVKRGVVRTVRKREGGDFFVLFTPDAGSSQTKRVAYRCRYVHIAVGYPGVRFLSDLQKYREEYNDYRSVVNAYEPHSHVYEEMLRRESVVLIRGAGIVASRVLQRIIDDRDHHGARTSIVHLFRNYPDGYQGDSKTFRRPAKKGWAYQAFNFPKSAWGGQVRNKLESLEGQARADYLKKLGGTNTAPRKDWQEQLARGEREGFYRQVIGTVKSVQRSQNRIETIVSTAQGEANIGADFIVDATGLEARIEEHRVLNDLLVHSGAAKNPIGRLDVDPDFYIRNLNNGAGRMFASGSITLGGYYAGVDSFLGLQYAAMRIHDALAKEGFGKKIGPLRSGSQWFKWLRNEAP